MDKQEALDKNWEWFVVQGKPQGLGVDTNASEPSMECMYRGIGGYRCAVGTLIPDDRYDPGMEGQGFVDDFVSGYQLYDLFPLKTIPFVMTMQGIHDGYKLSDHGNFTDYMRKELTELAKEHDLTIPKTPVAA